ncbi:MAG: DUF5658 family protein [Terriglobales bacterium]|jgi:hypothetical protein
MKYLLSILLLGATMQAQSFTASNSTPPKAPIQRPFWTVENKTGFGILAGLIAADAITTQRGLNEGMHEANPLMRPFVTHGAAGQAAGSSLGFGTGVGVAYLFHRSHHYKAERIALRVMIAGEGGFVANNIVALR